MPIGIWDLWDEHLQKKTTGLFLSYRNHKTFKFLICNFLTNKENTSVINNDL